MKKPKDPPFTFPKLSQLVDLLIGDADNCIIPRKYSSLAELLEVAARDTFICAIQWNDENDQPLHTPVLWRYQRYMESVERWKAQKERSRLERIQRFIFAANVQKVAMACERYFLMDAKFAESTAFGLMNSGRKGPIRELNVKLIEREEEL